MDSLRAEAPGELWLTGAHWQQMRSHVDRQAPNEACGLIAGRDSQARQVIPVANILQSPVRFRMAPEEQWKAFQNIEQMGLELIAIYHSHPYGPEAPSATDIAEAYYPETVQLIWFRSEGEWRCRAYRIQAGQVQEVSLHWLNRE